MLLFRDLTPAPLATIHSSRERLTGRSSSGLSDAKENLRDKLNHMLNVEISNSDLKYPLLKKINDKKKHIVDHIINIEAKLKAIKN